MDYEIKTQTFGKLSDKYIEVLEKIIDYAYLKKILPLKICIGLPMIKKYLFENKVLLIQYGIEYLLTNKNYILNITLESLDDLESELSDNQSRKSRVNDINMTKKILRIDSTNLKDLNDDFILDLMIEIKNNSKKLCVLDREVISGYIEILMIILSSIKDIFSN
jgi:hypothetical protein